MFWGLFSAMGSFTGWVSSREMNPIPTLLSLSLMRVISHKQKQKATNYDNNVIFDIYIFESCHINIIYLCAFKHRF